MYKKYLLALLLFCAIPGRADAPALKTEQEQSMHYLVLPKPTGQAVSCTAYAIDAHVLMTAEHCNFDASESGVVFIDADIDDIRKHNVRPFKVTEKYFDEEDHMIMVIPDATFSHVISTNFRRARKGEHVYFWGNPQGARDWFREGVTIGEEADAETQFRALMTFEMPVRPGDSGSMIFGENGDPIAPLTYNIMGSFAGAFPVAFSRDTIEAASGRHGANCAVESHRTQDEDGKDIVVPRYTCRP